MQPDGSARIVEEHSLFGFFAPQQRALRHLDDENLHDKMLRAVRGFAPRTRLIDFSVQGMHELSDPVVVRRTSQTPMFLVGSGGHYFMLRLFDLNRTEINRVHPQRLYPLERQDLYRETHLYRFHLPPGMRVRELPTDITAQTPWSDYRGTWRLDGNLLQYEDVLEFTARQMNADQFDGYEAFLRTMREQTEKVLLLERQ